MKDAGELLRRFRSDFAYYAPRALKILDKEGNLVPLRLNRAQLHLDGVAQRQLEQRGYVRVIVVKGRQQGSSTYIEGRGYWHVSGEFGRTFFILTHEDKATGNLFRMAKRFHENCPAVIRPHTKHSNATELVFDRLDSRYVIGTAKSEATGRSFTGQYFHGSEAAFWPNARENFAALGQAIPVARGTEVWIESTGNGVGNDFHALWQRAVRKQSDYEAVFLPWYWQDEYRRPVPPDFVMDAGESEYAELYDLDAEQIAWRRFKIRDEFGGNESAFDQEYPASPELAFQRRIGEAMIPLRHIEAARRRQVDALGVPIMGIDPSDGEEAALALVLRQGRRVTKCERHYGLSTMQQVAVIVRRVLEWQPGFVYGDAGGVGSGIIGRANELLDGAITRVLFGERAYQPDLYRLRADELWGEMMLWFANEEPQIVDDDVLVADLNAPNRDEDSSRRVVRESKKSMKKRGLDSPDSGDALALTFTMPGTKGSTAQPPEGRDYDWRVGG